MAEKDHNYRSAPIYGKEKCCQTADASVSLNAEKLKTSPDNSLGLHFNDNSFLRCDHNPACPLWLSCTSSYGCHPKSHASSYSISSPQKRKNENPGERKFGGETPQIYEIPHLARLLTDQHGIRNITPSSNYSSSESFSHFLLENGESENYRNFIYKLWVENSLDSSTLDYESSTLPTSSSEGCQFPFSFDNLTEKPNVSEKRKQIDENKLSESKLKYAENSSTIYTSAENICSTALVAKEIEPHPVDTTKESLIPQGEARPTLFLSSKVSLIASPKANSYTVPRICIEPAPANVYDPLFKIMKNKGSDHSAIHPISKGKCPCDLLSPRTIGLEKSEERTLQSPAAEQNNCATKLCLCQREIHELQQALQQAEHKITFMTSQIEEQSSHLRLLLKEKENLTKEPTTTHVLDQEMSYPVFPQGECNPPHHMYPSNMETRGYKGHPSLGRRATYQPYSSSSYQYPVLGYGEGLSHFDSNVSRGPDMGDLHRDPRALVDLRDKIVALQMQNIELSLFLRREEQKRIEAEYAVHRERNYAKKLEENIQDLSSSRLVMDPSSYKEVADKYIANKKKPVRRTHTCSPYLTTSDLVCDATKNNQDSQLSSSSCPSSPLCSKFDIKCSSSSDVSSLGEISASTSPSYEGSPSFSPTFRNSNLSPPIYDTARRCSSSPESASKWSMEVSKSETSSLSPLEYEHLLKSLEDLNTRSSPS